VISREEILKAAREQGLTPNVVEKDYVLGWLLAGIAQHTLLSGWVFKGGTCLKKVSYMMRMPIVELLSNVRSESRPKQE